MICFAISKCSVKEELLLDHAEYFFLTDDEVLVAIQLDFLTGVLAEQDRVARFHVERRHFPVFLDAALADGDDFSLLRLLFGGVRNDDAADFLLALFNALDDDAVV